MRANRLALVVSLAGVLAGCNVDFGFGCRRVAGTYCLQQWEDNSTYYLNDRAAETNEGGGAIDGTVQRIAWTRDLILVERRANFRGDRDGWMLIDVAGRKMRGPIAEAEAHATLTRAGMRAVSAADAWRGLGR